MTASYKDRIFATVAYADIFDYPLSEKEVGYWMIGTNTQKLSFSSRLEKIRVQHTRYITLKGRKSIIALREKKKRIAQEKWHRAFVVAEWYRWIPSVLLVGVTGGLAMENANTSDDIDLFFITSPNTIWVSRMLVTIVTHLKGVRRTPNASQVADAICLNMFMDQSALTLAKSEQDLFAAHEVLQMKPLWQRGNVYGKFLRENSWVKEYLPTAWKDKIKQKQSALRITVSSHSFALWRACLMLFEPWTKIFQLWYMRKRRTTEVIEPGVLRFHPRDARLWVKKKYASRLKKMNVPLDRIFYRG